MSRTVVISAALRSARESFIILPMLSGRGTAGLVLDRPVVDCGRTSVAVLARRHAVGRPEGPAEVRGVDEAPAGADGADRAVAEGLVAQVLPAALEAAGPGPPGHRLTMAGEQLVEVPGR